jgi:hypothetical protein
MDMPQRQFLGDATEMMNDIQKNLNEMLDSIL